METRKKHILIVCGALLGLLILTGALKMTVLAFDRRLPGEAAPVMTAWEAPSGERYWRVSAGAANAWLLPASGGYLMVDTGYPGDYAAFQRGLDEVGIGIEEIRYLFITHAHDEHAGFAAALKNNSGCTLILPELSLPGLASGRFDWQGVSVNPAVELLGRLYNLFKNRDFSFPPVIPDSGDWILSGSASDLPRSLVGIAGTFLATPGHSADSWSLTLDNGIVFAGDAAMNTLHFFGTGYRPIFMEDRQEVYASLELLKSRGARWILTGHGDPFPAENLPRYLEQTGPGPGLSALGSYLMKLTPGFLLMFLLLFLGGRNNQGLRIFLYLLGFILMRDLMTPFRFWTFGSGPVFWIRFAADGALLAVLALASLGMSALVLINERRAGNKPMWFKAGAGKGTMAGLLGALAVTLPLLMAYRGILQGERGGAFPASLVPLVFFLGLSGNLLEELLFRGYLHPWLEKSGLSGFRAALSSGLLFGLCHVFLAYTVTTVGWPLVVFATWEGILCGFIHRKYGLAPAVLTHGLAVSLLAVV
jgi:uncharacterized protein